MFGLGKSKGGSAAGGHDPWKGRLAFGAIVLVSAYFAIQLVVSLQTLWLLIFGAIGLALGAWLSLRGLGQGSRDPLLIAYRRFNNRLARAGVTRGEDEGPVAFGERAALKLPHAAPAILELTRRFAEQRYGESANDADISHRVRLARELRAFRLHR